MMSTFSTNDVLAYTTISTLSFFALNWSLDYLPVPTKYADKSRRHKWRNVVGSTIHAVVAATGGSSGIYCKPELLEDHMNTPSAIIYRSAAISVGYFIYDFIDMAMYGKIRESLPLLGHHVLAAIYAGMVSLTSWLHGLTAISQLIEINGVFLHLRHILLMWGVDKASLVYQINGVVNVATYVVFRLGIFAYDTWWMTVHRADLGGVYLPCMALYGLVMNSVLFYRLISSDYLRQPAAANISNDVAKRQDMNSNLNNKSLHADGEDIMLG